MLDCKEARVGIVCNGNEVEEYAVTRVDDHVVECFIASSAGEKFSLRFRNNLRDEYIQFKYFMDGISLDSFVCGPDATKDVVGVSVSKDKSRPFIFSSVETTDDESAHAEDTVAQALGTIEIHCFRCVLVGDSVFQDGQSSGLECRPIHERSKKAGVHRISLGQEFTSRTTRCMTRLIDSRDSPYAIYRIRYRPRAVLIAQGIIQSQEEIQEPAEEAEDYREPAANAGSKRNSDHAQHEHTRKKQRVGGSESRNVKQESMHEPTIKSETQDQREELTIMKDQLLALQRRIVEMEQRGGRQIKQEVLTLGRSLGEPIVVDLTDD
ncbi:hypothetical protein OBBRIDRAFT_124152 [Obba rivulosa]|uniref:DUF7918 domain-containing protein n=1 Tax=Obba rivulosa TaxID=1052685 RepID=A0A8E2DRS1_9APHY|nr:hypothetical protein OBBRIDRAFT_124152 [Obba rivulosa]